MTPLRVGVVGCGMIAARYIRAAPAFEGWRPVACADLDTACAEVFADEHGLQRLDVDELIASPDLDLVLNLTPPKAHAPLVRAALKAGKHVYTEKPLAATVAEARSLVAEANERGLRLGCAPDTFLGAAYSTGRRLIDEGAIGQPLGAAATMLVGGPESWHPNAEMFYRAGGGPLLDIAPYYLTALVSLLGPVASLAGFAETLDPVRHARRRRACRRDNRRRGADDAATVLRLGLRRARHAHGQLRGDRPVPERPRRPRQHRLARPP